MIPKHTSHVNHACQNGTVRDNLLGNGRFCPVIRRTTTLEDVLRRDLAAKARDTVGRTGAHLVARAASFLLRADSRASFEIEGERPPRNRLERWGRAVLQAGKNPLTLDEIMRLLPEFIGARPDDLDDLMAGLLDANNRMRQDGIDPVLQLPLRYSGLSTSIRSRTATDASTAASSITSSPNASSRRRAWCSRSHLSCLTGSTTTAPRCKIIPAR